jgi:hypothetical protein
MPEGSVLFQPSRFFSGPLVSLPVARVFFGIDMNYLHSPIILASMPVYGSSSVNDWKSRVIINGFGQDFSHPMVQADAFSGRL